MHPAELGLFLQCLAGRNSHYGWAGIIAGAIRKLILEVAAHLQYSSTKENFPSRSWEGRNKLTGLPSYLLESDPQLQLTLLFYS